ncbi:MAG TPA: hypothetical protein VEJ38_08490 [Candidatus Acidoferrales bacterium]|nr:hypothetical protein [Candidatus Acidoferrales bacterium]
MVIVVVPVSCTKIPAGGSLEDGPPIKGMALETKPALDCMVLMPNKFDEVASHGCAVAKVSGQLLTSAFAAPCG